VQADETKPQTIINIKAWVLVLGCLVIATGGLSGFFLPSPTVWHPFEDCEYIEGVVVDKEKTQLFAAGPFSHSRYSITVTESDTGNNSTIHVSPAVYMTSQVGGYYAGPICS